ncbi:hypothetical protein [Alkalihalobacterium bogoriense]|uniref:hypothetical protein n=1 Tax=Alkalihalobacterium bogoriense TaxID=246272 RepID=UPI00047BE342|nr:hypothetical protein [Alkalihalobacterium bogoriense]
MVENILVCVSNPNHAEKLIQRGKTLADAFSGNCYVLFVSPNSPDRLSFNEVQLKVFYESLADKYRLSFIIRYEQKNVAVSVCEVTNEYNITQIVLGQAIQSRFEYVMKEPLINSILKRISSVDIHVVEVSREWFYETESHDKGVPSFLSKSEEGYALSFEKPLHPLIQGIFFKESSTDFENGFFVIRNETDFTVIRVRNGTVNNEDIAEELDVSSS